MSRWLVLVLVASLVGLAACAPKVTAGPPVAGGFGPDDLVLRVEVEAGFGPPEWRYTELPMISVYGDGRIITTTDEPLVYPGRAYPDILLRRVTTADVRRLAELARAAGVGNGQDLGNPPIADGSTTRFSLLTSTGVVRTSVYALGPRGDGPGLTASQRAGRTSLSDLVDQLSYLERTLGSVPRPEVLTPSALIAVAQSWTDPQDPQVRIPPPPPVPWPGPALPGRTLGAMSCVLVSGAAVPTVLAAARAANRLTPWTYGGGTWALAFRPLLPDESDCPS
jgi:hypothetical protein